MRNTRRSCAGSMLAESASSILIMIPFLGLALNAAFGLMAYEGVDWACRDATRAAAAAMSDPNNPKSPALLAQSAADATLKSHQIPGVSITAKIVDYSYTVQDVSSPDSGPDTNNFYLCDPTSGTLSNPHAGPSVTVICTAQYKLPFPVLSFDKDYSDGKPIEIRQMSTFPILTPTLWVPES